MRQRKRLIIILSAVALLLIAAILYGVLTGRAGKIGGEAEKQEEEEEGSGREHRDGESAFSDLFGGKEEEKEESQAVVSDADSEAESGTETEEEPDPVEEILSSMTLHEKICQMFIITPESLTGYEQVTETGDATREALSAYPVGGLIYFSQNLVSMDQTRTMLNDAKGLMPLGLFTAVDEEGGIVARVMTNLGTTQVGSMYGYRSEGSEKARSNALTMGTDIKSAGFNLDFAPVADVWSNPANAVIGERAYSDNYEEAAMLVSAAVEGFHEAGVMCTLKHFPGHGDATEDSHNQSAYVYKSKEELMSGDWLPFKAGIDAGADFVMVGHITVPSIDENCATVSEALTTGVLREELGFQGVIITDSLQMAAVADLYASGDLAIRSVSAGADMLLMPVDFKAAVTALENAVETGVISEERIDESVRRILKTKQKYGLLP